MSDFRSMQDMFNGTVNAPVNRQPTPLFLADALNADSRSLEIKLQAASELRRLYGLCIQLEEELNAKSQRTWVGLTSVDWNDFNAVKSNDPQYVAAWAEAKLKEKNNG